jgi:hypothetical protein
MFNLREELAWCTTRLDSDAFAGFVLGSGLTLTIVLTMSFLFPTHVVENHVLEAARQALHGIPLPP